MHESAEELTWIGIAISGHSINNLCHADDIELIATSLEALQRLVDKVDMVSWEYGLEVSTKKTKVASKVKINVRITRNGATLEQMEQFLYFGSIITETGDCSKEITTRLGIARSVMASLNCLCFKTHACFGVHHKNLNDDRPILSVT